MAYTETTSGATFSTNQTVTLTAASTNVFDVTGAGVGNAPAMIGAGGTATAMGVDIGAGDGMAVPEVLVQFTTNGTGTGTITVNLQSAPDNGSYSPGTYTTIYTSEPFVGTSVKAGQLLKFNVPPNPPGITAPPRFYRLDYIGGTANSVTLTVNAALLLNAPDNVTPTIYGNNFSAV
jgi:hypothetical protein